MKKRSDKLKTYGTGMNKIVRPADMPRFLTPGQVHDIRTRIFERSIGEIEAFAWSLMPEEIPENAKYEYGEDGYFALALLSELRHLEEAIEADDCKKTAAIALSLGQSYNRIQNSYQWNDHALRGKKFLSNTGGDNLRRKKESAAREKLFREMAVKIKKAHPNWSKNSIAHEIHKELLKQGISEGIAPSTIRQKI